MIDPFEHDSDKYSVQEIEKEFIFYRRSRYLKEDEFGDIWCKNADFDYHSGYDVFPNVDGGELFSQFAPGYSIDAPTVYLFCSTRVWHSQEYPPQQGDKHEITDVLTIDTDGYDRAILKSEVLEYVKTKYVESGISLAERGISLKYVADIIYCSAETSDRAAAVEKMNAYASFLIDVLPTWDGLSIEVSPASDLGIQHGVVSDSTESDNQPGSLELSITDSCRDGNDIQYRIFGYSASSPGSSDYIGLAPESGRVYIAKDSGGEVTSRHACKTNTGETVRSWCYGANRPNGNYWGVGIKGDKGCEDCCASCPATGTSKRSMSLACDY